jgi:aminobenzoyl-glutamate utilization protein B
MDDGRWTMDDATVYNGGSGGLQMMMKIFRLTIAAIPLVAVVYLEAQQPSSPPAAPVAPTAAATVDPRQTALKAEAVAGVEDLHDYTQKMVDSVFSFGELGFQEVETSRYLTNILRQQGFTIEQGIAGIPTAWIASYGSGKPVIALGSDIDGIPQGSQKPGVAYHDPLIEGAPGHGEGHNSGMPLNVTAAIVLKKIMQREKIQGTIKLWPGVAEELLATKAYYVRDGYFKDVDIVLFAHVGSNFGVSWGDSTSNGLVSVEYTFRGETAHSAGAPWRGRSALDAAMLMDIGWNYRREHLRIQQRSHSVITNGGDQPNVVPPVASIWYYFRETDYPNIKRMWEIGDNMAKAAALMTDTTMTSRVLGSAWPQHMNKTVAETMYENIVKVGLPKWTDADQTLAKALQKELGVEERGLPTEIPKLNGRVTVPDDEKRGGGSDDIGDISWNVPTVTLRYPANIEAGPGHSWANAIAMATPIAHKGVTSGAKVQAMTALDFLLNPRLVSEAWEYFRNVQTKNNKYTPLIRPEDKPAIWLNQATMAKYREQMKKYYYDPSRYPTYLEQLGIKYPTVK